MSTHPPRMSCAALAVALVLSTAWPTIVAASREAGGARFASSRVVDGAAIVLVNTALYRYLWFDVYAAALYLAPGAGARAALADDVARRLEVVYLRDVRAADLARAAQEVLARNLEADVLAALAPQIERLHAWYRDVGEGDRIALNWVPGQGTTLEMNGERLGAVGGPEFARAYFSIWLGERPIDDALRAALLAPQSAGGARR